MEERTPVEKATEDAVNKEEAELNEQSKVVGSQTVEESIQELRDRRSLSLLLGFDGNGFDGDDHKAANVWDWVTSRYPNSNEALTFTKSIIKMLGVSEVKKPLLTKVYQWLNLQNSIDELKDRQDILNEDG
jgi:hypothetical protein